MYYPVAMPKWVQKLFPDFLYRIEEDKEKVLYLTFDDGPIPKITPWVLEQLAAYDAQATFFCVGANIEKNPSVYQAVLDAGHRVGNHTFNHLNGWKTAQAKYLENVATCQAWMETDLFRPPYGKLRLGQARKLKQAYKVVMWDIIAGDFDPSISGEKCWQNIVKNTTKGSIIVLHDSKKSWERLQYVLPKLLEHYNNLGFQFKAIP